MAWPAEVIFQGSSFKCCVNKHTPLTVDGKTMQTEALRLRCPRWCNCYEPIKQTAKYMYTLTRHPNPLLALIATQACVTLASLDPFSRFKRNACAMYEWPIKQWAWLNVIALQDYYFARKCSVKNYYKVKQISVKIVPWNMRTWPQILCVLRSEYPTWQLELYVFDSLCTFMTVLTQFMYVYVR